jgi:hypothetical protein
VKSGTDGPCVSLTGKFTAFPTFIAPAVANQSMLTFGLVTSLLQDGGGQERQAILTFVKK